jgi:hypothetical protein
MNDLPRQKLAEILAEQGIETAEDARRCKGLLNEKCPQHRKENRALADAIVEGVVGELRGAGPGEPAEALTGRLAGKLQEATDLTPEEARWAVESWAFALRTVAPPAAPGPVPSPTLAAAPADEGGIEDPAHFYLGRDYDLNSRKVLEGRQHRVDYASRNLTTHGVIVGMTGSGKTGLSIAILEEAAIDAIPALIIDPKGDLTNLLLQFPDLDPHQFARWLNPEDARQKNLSVPEYARQLSERWRKGLADSEQTPERIKYVRQAVDYRIFTPGSEAGLPLSILRTFAAPRPKPAREDLTQKISATATALLGLSGIAADPIQSREHVLVAQLLQKAWDEGRDLDLPTLITQIPRPPISRVGAYDMETFFPARDRVEFASRLNNVLASPGFATWTAGEPLDLGSMLFRNRRPQHLIFYLAHLDDTQRMFFTTLLLEEVLGWTRRQSGTTSLRALLYFDEVFGYLPPHPANPPSKAPLLTLLKQARAFGVGVLLATQNPVDLDYKALSNAGTWFVGKLQTERDKARLLDGLESVAAEYGTMTDRGYLEKVIASLGNRIFLLHNINEGQPRVFQSKWALSFLRGPLTRDQVAELVRPLKEQDRSGAVVATLLCPHCRAELPPGVADRCPACGKNPWVQGPAGSTAPVAPLAQAVPVGEAPRPVTLPAAAPPASHTAPVLAADVTQFYLGRAAPRGALTEYQPKVLGVAEVTFVVDRRKGKEHLERLPRLADPPAAGRPVAWEGAEPFALDALTPGPQANARWKEVPESLNTGRKLKALEKAFADFLYSTRKLPLLENRSLGLVSEVGESEGAFRERCRQAAAEEARQALEMERAKFAPRFEALGMKLPADSAAGSGGSILGWLFSSFKAANEDSGPPSSRQEEKQRKLKADYQAKQAEIREKWRRVGDEAAPIQVKPRKADVRVTHFGLAWVPAGQPTVAAREERAPAPGPARPGGRNPGG